jgi:TfoX/Sxy family transcriptional regulator of competence genes
MASQQAFVDYVIDQTGQAGTMTARKMFGDYALYCNGKVVALICDNRLYIKPTEEGRKFIGKVVEAPAFPGAKPSFLIEDQLDNRQWVGKLIAITYAALPEAKQRKATRKSKEKR